jgi:hypothetical protein
LSLTPYPVLSPREKPKKGAAPDIDYRIGSGDSGEDAANKTAPSRIRVTLEG